jgi:hypothetical protein
LANITLPRLTPYSPKALINFSQKIDAIFMALEDQLRNIDADTVGGVVPGPGGIDTGVDLSGLFFESMEDDIADTWTARVSSGTITYPNNGTTGGRVIRSTGGETWIEFPENIPFHPDRLYRMRFKARLVSAPADPAKDLISVGLQCFAADGTTLVGTDGTTDYTKTHWVAAANYDMGTAAALGTFVERGGYFRGHGTPGSTVPSGDPTAPAQFHDNARYFRPVLRLNHSAGDGVMEVDYVSIDIADEADSVGDGLDKVAPVIGVDPATQTATTESIQVNAVTAAKTDLAGVSSSTGVIRTPLMSAEAFHVGADSKLEFMYTTEEITHSTYLLRRLNSGVFVKARVGGEANFHALPHVAIIEREIRDDKVVSIETQDAHDNPFYTLFPVPKWDPETIGKFMTTADPSVPFRNVPHDGRPVLLDAYMLDAAANWKFDLVYTASGATGSVVIVVYIDGLRVQRTVYNNAQGFIQPIYDTALGVGETIAFHITPYELPDGAGEKGDTFIRGAQRTGGTQPRFTDSLCYMSNEGEITASPVVNMEISIDYTTANEAGGDKVDVYEQINGGEWVRILQNQSTGTQTVTVDLGEKEYSINGIPEIRAYKVVLHDGAGVEKYTRAVGYIDTRAVRLGADGGTGAGESGGETGTISVASATRTTDGNCITPLAMKNSISWTGTDVEPGDTVQIDVSSDLEGAGFGPWTKIGSARGLAAASGTYVHFMPGKQWEATTPDKTWDRKYRVMLLSGSGVVKDSYITATVPNDYISCGVASISVQAERRDSGTDAGTETRSQSNAIIIITAAIPAGYTIEVIEVTDGGDEVVIQDGIDATAEDIIIEEEISGTVYDPGGTSSEREYIINIYDETGAPVDSTSSGVVDNTGNTFVDPV